MTGVPSARPLDLQRLFYPKGVVVVGASSDPKKLSYRPLKGLLSGRYSGKLGVVTKNGRGPEAIKNIKAEFASDLAELTPGQYDVALLLRPAEELPSLVRECSRQAIPFAVSIASGFEEAGNVALAESLRTALQESSTRLVGPNCVGVVSVPGAFTGSISTVAYREPIRCGSTAVVTQSGAIGNAILQGLIRVGLGLRYWVSYGNESDLTLSDYLSAFVTDEEVRSVLISAEAMRDAEGVLKEIDRLRTSGRSVAILKPGFSREARSAMATHTGKISSNARFAQQLLETAGAAVVSTPEELVATAAIGASWRSMKLGGIPRVAVISPSGGFAVLLSDLVRRAGLELASFSNESSAALSEVLGQTQHVNPIDTGATDLGSFVKVVSLVLSEREVSVVVVVATSLSHEVSELMAELRGLSVQHRSKLVLVVPISNWDAANKAEYWQELPENMRFWPSPAEAFQALANVIGPATLSKQRRFAQDAEIETSAENATDVRSGLDELLLLEKAGFSIARTVPVDTLDMAISTWHEIDGPVFVKGLPSSGLAHKSDHGLVIGPLNHMSALHEAWRTLQRRLGELHGRGDVDWNHGETLEADLVVQEAAQGVELMLGSYVDPEFGLCVVCGIGGPLTEVFGHHSLILSTYAASDIREVLLRNRFVGPLLSGYRDLVPEEAIDWIINGITGLFAIMKDLSATSIDINPMFVEKDQLLVSDATIFYRE